MRSATSVRLAFKAARTDSTTSSKAEGTIKAQLARARRTSRAWQLARRSVVDHDRHRFARLDLLPGGRVLGEHHEVVGFGLLGPADFQFEAQIFGLSLGLVETSTEQLRHFDLDRTGGDSDEHRLVRLLGDLRCGQLRGDAALGY